MDKQILFEENALFIFEHNKKDQLEASDQADVIRLHWQDIQSMTTSGKSAVWLFTSLLSFHISHL